jgi:hypothetical protein
LWGYHQGKGCGRMTAKAESPPTNGKHQDFRNGCFLVPSAAIVVRTAV